MADKDQPTNRKSSLSYKDAGVNIDEGNALIDDIAPLAKRTKRAGVMGALGGFGGLFDLAACDYEDPILVSANDGVGTKLKIAIEMGYHKSVGIDLVAMCVNDLIVQGAEPLFFLDYFASGQLERGVARDVIEGISDGCLQAGCALLGGETAEMPGMYQKGDYDLAGFSVGAVERTEILPKPTMQAGDHLIGLASSGVHSNGFSLVRHCIKHAGLSFESPAPFAKNEKLGRALLTPTKIYVAPILKALKRGIEIKGLSHITGGGLLENLPRVIPDQLAAHISAHSFDIPPVFSWLQQAGNIAQEEMLRTFNCGIGMVAIVSAADAQLLTDTFNNDGTKAVQIGVLEPKNDGDPVIIHGDLE